MNPYSMPGSGNETSGASSLSARLAAWHDAMVAHERRLRAGRGGDACDEECSHAEARALWAEALEAFGERAHGLTFLRSRALGASERSEEFIAPMDVVSEAADNARRPSDAAHRVSVRRPKLFDRSFKRSRTASAEL
jgi:hypothetical protein